MAESSPTFESFIQSALFTFYIGPKRQQFVAHSGAIAATLEHFNALVNGDMVEAKTRVVEYLDVKPKDFVRFLECAYRHDYTVPHHTEETEFQSTDPPALPDSGAPSIATLPPTVEELTPELVEIAIRSDEDKKCVWSTKPLDKKRLKVRSRFEKLNYLSTGDPKAGILRSFNPQYNSSPRQKFTPIFLAHARLYSFADMRLVQPLKSLALHKLHRTLSGFELHEGRIGDILELARYAYDQGPDRTASGKIDAIRNLVVKYIACELDTIGKSQDFKRLLEEGGEFVSDFWEIVHKKYFEHRICDLAASHSFKEVASDV